MNDSSRYISDSRAKGLSDDQIKLALETSHWSPEQIQSAFDATNLIPVSHTKINTFFVATIILIALVSIIAIMFLFTSRSKPASTVVAVSSPNPTASAMPVVAFIKLSPVNGGDTATSSGRLTLFDFTTHQLFTPALPANQSADFLPILSPWSPSGYYIAMLGVRQISLPQPLFLYDSSKKTVSYLMDANTSPELKQNYSGFQFSSTWPNDQYFIYTTIYNPLSSTSSSQSVVTVDTSGKVNTSVRPDTLLFHNDRLEITYTFRADQTPLSIKLDNKPLPTMVGKIVGLTTKYIVTLQKPEKINLQSISENKDLIAQMQQAKDPRSIQVLMDKASNIQAGSTILMYPISNPASSSAILWPFNSWVVVEAQTLSSKNSLVLHEQDSLFAPTKSRFSLLNLDDPTHPKVIAETPAVNVADAQIVDESGISITPDDRWLVVLVEGKISAWNLDFGENLTLCDSNCGSLRVYNPNRIRFR